MNLKAPKDDQSLSQTGRAANPAGFARVLRSAHLVETTVAVSALVLMTLVVFADVLGRELFDQGLDGAQRIGVYAFVVAGFLGLPLATSTGGHLRPQFADNVFPAHAQPLLTRVQHAIAALLSLGLAWFGLGFARQTLALGEVSPILEIPIGLVQLVLPYAFASSGLRHAIFAVQPSLAPTETGDAS